VVAVTESDARKERLGRKEALKLARQADRLIAVKGTRHVTLDLNDDTADDDALLTHLLGPTGNLRAPTIRVGRTLVVGFHANAYQVVVQA
jgi:arsenate reductase-like glutaredoxin family protein